VVYIRREANLVAAPSSQRALDMWCLQKPTQQELLHLVQSTLDSPVCTDSFAYSQSSVVKDSKIHHSTSLSSQCCLQWFAPRLVTDYYALDKPVMSSTVPSFGKTLSVKGKRYSYLPLLVPPSVISRSVADFNRPLPLATTTTLRQTTSSRHGRALRQSRGAQEVIFDNV
jgi:hypothetical protein